VLRPGNFKIGIQFMKKNKKKKAGAAKRQAAPKPAAPDTAVQDVFAIMYMPLEEYREKIEKTLRNQDPRFIIEKRASIVEGQYMIDMQARSTSLVLEIKRISELADATPNQDTLDHHYFIAAESHKEIRIWVKRTLANTASAIDHDTIFALAPVYHSLLNDLGLAGREAILAMYGLLKLAMFNRKAPQISGTQVVLGNDGGLYIPGVGILIPSKEFADRHVTVDERQKWHQSIKDMGALRTINGTEYVLIIRAAGLFFAEANEMKNQPAQMWSPDMATKWASRCELMFLELQNVAELVIEWALDAGASRLTTDLHNEIELLIRNILGAVETLADAYLKQYDSLFFANCQIQMANQSNTNPKDKSKK
jgi:hypothetical protein